MSEWEKTLHINYRVHEKKKKNKNKANWIKVMQSLHFNNFLPLCLTELTMYASTVHTNVYKYTHTAPNKKKLQKKLVTKKYTRQSSNSNSRRRRRTQRIAMKNALNLNSANSQKKNSDSLCTQHTQFNHSHSFACSVFLFKHTTCIHSRKTAAAAATAATTTTATAEATIKKDRLTKLSARIETNDIFTDRTAD